jgi:hypothetical protein
MIGFAEMAIWHFTGCAIAIYAFADRIAQGVFQGRAGTPLNSGFGGVPKQTCRRI